MEKPRESVGGEKERNKAREIESDREKEIERERRIERETERVEGGKESDSERYRER